MNQPQRRSLPPQHPSSMGRLAASLPASPHHIGTWGGTHPEDQPYSTTPYASQQRQQQGWNRPPVQADEDGEAEDDVEQDNNDDLYLDPRRTPRSAIRYRSTMTADQPPLSSSRQAVTIYRAHRPPPQGRTTSSGVRPAPTTAASKLRSTTRRHVHWTVYLGLALLVMLAGWVLLSLLSAWWQVTQDNWHYGRPRTFQTDAVVGHNDSVAHPSHFLVLNLSRQIEIVEFPGGDASKGKIYLGPTLIGAGEDLAVVTLTFKDVNGDGIPDMILNVQESHFIFINDHGQFRPAKPGERVTF